MTETPSTEIPTHESPAVFGGAESSDSKLVLVA